MIKNYAETYEEHKSGKYEYVKGYGRLGCYQGLDYIENILKDDKYYSEELEDGFIFIQSYITCVEQQCKKQKEIIDKAIEFLYKIKFDKTDKYICISEYIEYQQLLDILKKEK